ncbi:MAG: CBS domain-containing protein [bacterium]|nr:CBS domain-containing protein [bacterium]
MNTARTVSYAFIQAHPDPAARILEGLPPEETVMFLKEMPSSLAVEIVQRMDLTTASDCLKMLEPTQSAELIAQIPMDLVTIMLRRMDAQQSEPILNALPDETAESLRLLLSYPEGTAGALMDSGIFTLPNDLTVEEALRRIREKPQHTMYYLYILNRNKALVGVLNIRELMLARPKERISSIMRTNVVHLLVRADHQSILAHPGWMEVHALPVVDDAGLFAGAIRYETLRRIEKESQHFGGARTAAAALGELYRIGLTGLLKAPSKDPDQFGG